MSRVPGGGWSGPGPPPREPRHRAPGGYDTYVFGNHYRGGQFLPASSGRMLVREIREVPENRRRAGGSTHLTLQLDRPYGTAADQIAEEFDYLMEQYLSTVSP